VNADKQREYSQISSNYQQVLKNTKNLRAKATEMVDIHNDPVMRAKLEELPETLPEVEAALDEATLKVNSTTDNPEVLVQYEQRKREIVETREELEGLSHAQDAKRVNLEKMKDPWESALKNTVTKVNTLFEKYMTELGFAGEYFLERFSLSKILLMI
jgi:chromosome segregation ATPase